ncbi:panthothenate synthetase [Bacillus sp. TS-2]|nr:panthothenate synthetase [Bacillus sp. TS-2]
MELVKTIIKMDEIVKDKQSHQQTIGYVATMGYLHEGHLNLVKQARNDCDIVVMSIFVNPLQFGPNEDFESYPRDEERDKQLAEDAGVDYLFMPQASEMYPTESFMKIRVEKGTDVLCGASRPGHFDGVATVVMKLFQIIEPTKAYFGLKDAQQVAIIKNMVKTFNLKLDIVACPTVREDDGLAKSSRNVYLSEKERALAPQLAMSLNEAKMLMEKGMHSRADIISFLQQKMQQISLGKTDYVDVLSFPALEAKELLKGDVIVALAYQFEKARLIDSILVTIKEEL